MKRACDILKSLQNKPQFSKLSSYRCIDRIRHSFSPPLQKMIKFAYIKNSILFFVLNHPGAKQEFDNSIQSIKSALKFVTPKECEAMQITDIRAFVTHTPTPKREEISLQAQTIPYYKERAKGEFKICVKDEKLYNIFKSIQEIVKKNHHDT
jgi:hypothetical protein